MEAVLDTKRGNNYIVTEYLAKNGVDKEKVARALRSSVSAASDPELYVRNVAAANSATTESVQSPMNAASGPRDTSGTLAAHSSADTTVTQRAGDVNGRSVENAGETVESREVQQEEPGTMRETVGLQQRGTTEKQNSVQRELQRWKVSEGATKTMSRNMPTGIADESRYAAAAH